MLIRRSDSFSASGVMACGRNAFSAWRTVSLSERLRHLKLLRKAIVSRADELVEAIGEDTHRLPLDILTGDLWVVLDQLRYYEKNAHRILSGRKLSSGSILYFGKSNEWVLEPLGVVLVLGPWNYPLQLNLISAVSAWIAGNAVILKPSEVTPRTNQCIAELFNSIGLPPGLVQVIQGGPEEGEALIAAQPDKICLTGSTRTGRRIAQLAAERLIPTVLELGGKDAMIVLSDALQERAVHAAVYGAFMNTGQTCVGIKRIFVHQTLFTSFLSQMIRETHRLRVDVGKDGDLGPLVREIEKKQIFEQVEDAIQRGAQLCHPQKWTYSPGLKLDPVILTNVPEGARLRNEETFGPVVWIESFESENEVIERVNQCPWGLSASVWSQNRSRAREFARSLAVGSVTINDVIIHVAQPGVPFGGEKNSGWGRSHGEDGLLEFVRKKTITITRGRGHRQRNWFPYDQRAFRWISRWMKFRFGVFLMGCILGGCPLALKAAENTPSPLPLCGKLEVEVKSIPDSVGRLAYALFSGSEGFPGQHEKALRKGYLSIPKNGKLDPEVTLEVKDLPCGNYSIAIYHDRNENEKLDKNFLGIPTESIGFSKNPKIRFGPPSFPETQFELMSKGTHLEVIMIH